MDGNHEENSDPSGAEDVERIQSRRGPEAFLKMGGLAFRMLQQNGVTHRWVGGLSILPLYYALANYDEVQPCLHPAHPIFYALLLFMLSALLSGICLLLLRSIRNRLNGDTDESSLDHRLASLSTRMGGTGATGGGDSVDWPRTLNGWRWITGTGATLLFGTALGFGILGLLTAC